MSEKRGKGPGFTRVNGKGTTAINGVMQKIKAEKTPHTLKNQELVECNTEFIIFESLQITKQCFPKQKIFVLLETVCVEDFVLCYKEQQTKKSKIHFQNFGTGLASMEVGQDGPVYILLWLTDSVKISFLGT